MQTPLPIMVTVLRMRTQGSTAVLSPALLCDGFNTKPPSLVTGLRDKQSHRVKTILAASPRIFGYKSTPFPYLEQSGDVAEDGDGERTVLVALLEPPYNYSVTSRNGVSFICRCKFKAWFCHGLSHFPSAFFGREADAAWAFSPNLHAAPKGSQLWRKQTGGWISLYTILIKQQGRNWMPPDT